MRTEAAYAAALAFGLVCAVASCSTAADDAFIRVAPMDTSQCAERCVSKVRLRIVDRPEFQVSGDCASTLELDGLPYHTPLRAELLAEDDAGATRALAMSAEFQIESSGTVDISFVLQPTRTPTIARVVPEGPIRVFGESRTVQIHGDGFDATARVMLDGARATVDSVSADGKVITVALGPRDGTALVVETCGQTSLPYPYAVEHVDVHFAERMVEGCPDGRLVGGDSIRERFGFDTTLAIDCNDEASACTGESRLSLVGPTCEVNTATTVAGCAIGTGRSYDERRGFVLTRDPDRALADLVPDGDTRLNPLVIPDWVSMGSPLTVAPSWPFDLFLMSDDTLAIRWVQPIGCPAVGGDVRTWCPVMLPSGTRIVQQAGRVSMVERDDAPGLFLMTREPRTWTTQVELTGCEEVTSFLAEVIAFDGAQVAWTDTGRAWVACRTTDGPVLFDYVKGRTELIPIALDYTPTTLAVQTLSQTLWAFDAGSGTLVVYDLATVSELGRFSRPPSYPGAALVPMGRTADLVIGGPERGEVTMVNADPEGRQCR